MFAFTSFDKMVSENKWVCPIEIKHQDKACYSPSKDRILLPEKTQFKDGESFYGTAFHECIHSTGTKERLNREMGGGFGSEDYAVEELIAELGSALTAQRYGFSAIVEKESLSYVKCWLKKLKEEPKFIWNVMRDVKKASNMLIEHLDAV